MPQRLHNSSRAVDPENYTADVDSTTRNEDADDTSLQSSNMDDVETAIDPANVLMATLIERDNSIPAVPPVQRSLPRTWREVFSLDALRKVRDSMAELILEMTGTLRNPYDLIRTAALLFPTAFLTIATGTQKSIQLIHNTAVKQIDEEYFYFGMVGFNTRPATVELNPRNLFAIRVESVPTIDYFKSIRDRDKPQSPKSADLIQLPICNSIALPPKIAEFILYMDETNASKIYKNVLQFCLNEDEVEHPSWIEVLNDAGEDPTQELEYKMTSTHLSLLQHLYAYSKHKSRRTAGFSLSDNEHAEAFALSKDRQLHSGQLYPEDNLENFEDASRSSSTRHSQDSRPQSRPSVNLQLDSFNPDIPHDVSRETDNPTSQSTGLPQQIRPNTRFNFTGSHNPHTQSNSTTPQAGNTTITRPQSNSLENSIQNLANLQSRFTQSMEQFVNDNAAHIRNSESGTRKVGNLVRQMVLNASTIDGENPAEDLTQFAKEMLTSSGDQPLIHMKMHLSQNKARATPTPRLINALKKGTFSYDNGIPDNFSITQLPQNLSGTDCEQLDIQRLLNMEENGTISELDTDRLNKSVLPISRTIHYLQDKANAFAGVTSAYFGPSSFASIESHAWADWITTHFNELQEIKATRDPLLPARIEIAISDQFNKFFKDAMLGVPDGNAFLASDTRSGILRRTICIDIPLAVQELLNKSSRKRESPSSNSTQSNNKKAKLDKVKHDNHPLELLVDPETYRNTIAPYLASNRDKCPKFNDSMDECLKYCLTGLCNSNCPRAASHSRVKKGTARFDKLKTFKDMATKHKPSQSSDFRKGEE